MSDFNWTLVALGAIAFIAFANVVIFWAFAASRRERRFNEFFVCLALYELGDREDASMPLGILRQILPCHPDEADELLAFLQSEKYIEVSYDRGLPLAILGARRYVLIHSGNWRHAFPPAVQDKLGLALANARRKYFAAAGHARAA